VNFQKPWLVFRTDAAKGALLTAALGLVFLVLPLGRGLTNLSYDSAFWFRENLEVGHAVILYMDEHSEKLLGQGQWVGWDRTIHAELLTNLARFGPKVVVFDVLFSPGHADQADINLVNAVNHFSQAAAGGKVVMGGRQQFITDHQGRVIGASPPESPFPELARVAPWGVAEGADENLTVREHNRDLIYKTPSLAWRAAEAALGRPPPDPLTERWINYYGPPQSITSFNYVDVLRATNLSAWSALLSNKLVFVGGGLRSVAYTGGITDVYRTPYTRWTGRWSPGVEITATAALNLMHRDWLKRLPPALECLIMMFCGTALSLGLANRRPAAAVGWAVLAVLLVAAAAIMLVRQTHFWFPWLIVAGTQVPCALAWSALTYSKRLMREKTTLEEKLARTSAAPPPQVVSPANPELEATLAGAVTEAVNQDGQAVAPTPGRGQAPLAVITPAPAVPDHQLLFRVGEGAYGEVWLARDILGSFHAAKIVYRKNFPQAAPYEREFNGLKRFTPISRAHPGLVNILHVGRNSKPEYIYYVMEAGDDEVTGHNIDPMNYSPRNLAKDLRKKGRLPLRECLQLSADLAAALEFLHQQHLLHRDIKPSNIIFVRGVPKLADIGLVTQMAAPASEVSYVGTHGYIPPEGPGTPAADVFSLGKVIYEAAFGMPCTAFPKLPTALLEQSGGSELLELDQIILRACENDPGKRFPSAADLRAALLELLRRLQ
jgi:CHASE2 domain-containing sensor protein